MFKSQKFLWLLPFAVIGSVRADMLEVDQASVSCSDLSGQPFCTIQAALDASESGDLVTVNAGTYRENIDFHGKDISLVSAAGTASTVIRPRSGGQAVRMGPRGRIEGFMIHSGSAASGGGLQVHGADTIIRGNYFFGNHSSVYGSAIAAVGSTALIERNVFSGNSCEPHDVEGVVTFLAGSSPTVVNNVFHHNLCTALNISTFGGISRPVVAFNTFVSNPVGIKIDSSRLPVTEQIYRNNILFQNDIGLTLESETVGMDPLWENNIVFDNGINYENIDDLTGQAGNISEDPKFAVGFGLLPLAADSPAVDAGMTVRGVLDDFLGNERIQDGDGDGVETPDIGAYELSPPVAVAGMDVTVLRSDQVTLDGLQSFDVDGRITDYAWRQVSGPTVELTAADTATPTFLAPVLSGVVGIELVVTDDVGAKGADVVQIKVNAAPKADAGSDFVVNQGATGALDGTGSSDSDGGIERFAWQRVAGPQIDLEGSDSPAPNFVAPNASTVLTFSLTITDNDGATATDDVNVRINAIPIADAGPDITVSAGARVTLDGSNSSDPDGAISSLSWAQTTGSSVLLSGSNSATGSFTAPNEQQILQFLLTATDTDGAQSSDTVSVVVVTAPSDPTSNEGGGGGSTGIIAVLSLLTAVMRVIQTKLPRYMQACER